MLRLVQCLPYYHVYLYTCVIVRQFASPTGMFKTCFKLDIFFE